MQIDDTGVASYTIEALTSPSTFPPWTKSIAIFFHSTGNGINSELILSSRTITICVSSDLCVSKLN